MDLGALYGSMADFFEKQNQCSLGAGQIAIFRVILAYIKKFGEYCRIKTRNMEQTKFSRFLADEDPVWLEQCAEAAIEKLQTLYPTKRIKASDSFSITIESDSLYALDGCETYFLGLVDDEYPALLRETDGELLTFRV